jgi:hypothetical protein
LYSSSEKYQPFQEPNGAIVRVKPFNFLLTCKIGSFISLGVVTLTLKNPKGFSLLVQ